MEMHLNIVNEIPDMQELYDVGGGVGCAIACVGGCLITYMAAAPMTLAVMDM